MRIGASSRRLIHVMFGGLVVVVALASVGVAAALEIDLTRARPVAAVAMAQVSTPRAADLVIARKSASGPSNVVQPATTALGAASESAPAVAAGVPTKTSALQQRYEPVGRAAAAKYAIDP